MAGPTDSDADQRAVGSGNRLTYTELHATALGLLLGVLVAFAYAQGLRLVAAAGGAFVVGLALGFDLRARAEPHVDPAEQVLQREPWYALGGFVGAGVLVLAVL